MNEVTVFRIYDPWTGDFIRFGRGLYAKNGRSVWLSKSGAVIARKHLPDEVEERVEVREYYLVPVSEEE